MPYIFTVEDGSGVPGANSYCSVAFADEYHEIDIHSSEWANASEGNKQKALSWATFYLDREFRFKGEKTDPDNPLEWPRTGAPDHLSDEIPLDLLRATAELARAYLLGKINTSGDAEISEVTILETLKVKAANGGASSGGVPPSVHAMLRRLTSAGTNVGFFKRV